MESICTAVTMGADWDADRDSETFVTVIDGDYSRGKPPSRRGGHSDGFVQNGYFVSTFWRRAGEALNSGLRQFQDLQCHPIE
jgi:hypothetical protein